ncbi:MAG: DUF3769 domain-containing protein, partial [Cyanobacteriota bacterium]|nr:DUF3769 domain-containing protein [Cyanobacteriota bacterium]
PSPTPKVVESPTFSQSKWVPPVSSGAVPMGFDESPHVEPTIEPPIETFRADESGALDLPPVNIEASLPEPEPEFLLPVESVPIESVPMAKVPVTETIAVEDAPEDFYPIAPIESWEPPAEPVRVKTDLPTFSSDSASLNPPIPQATSEEVIEFGLSFDRALDTPSDWETPQIPRPEFRPVESNRNQSDLPEFWVDLPQYDESAIALETPVEVTPVAITQKVPRDNPTPEVPSQELRSIESMPNLGDLPAFSTDIARLNQPTPPSTFADLTGDLTFSIAQQTSSDSPQFAQTGPTGDVLFPMLSEPSADPFKRPIQPSPPGGGLSDALGLPEPIEVIADRQEFDEQRNTFTAQGNVVMRFQGAIVDADWLEVNLRSRQAIGEGNVALTQPEQVIRGDRFRYNLVQETGTIFQARGEISNVTPDPNAPETAQNPDPIQSRLLSDRILANQPLEVTPTGGGLQVSVGGGRGSSESSQFAGNFTRFRFEAERVDFYPGGWQGNEVRITNDPFGPEFEVRSDTATFTQISPLQDEILLESPRFVFDDGFSLPLFRERFVIDRRPRDPTPIQIGFDGRDRGGLFLFRDFEVLQTRNTSLTLSPQYYLQRGFDRRDMLSLEQFGIVARLNSTLSESATFNGIASFTNLNPDTFDPDGDPFDEDDGDLRASARVRQQIGTHTLTTEYSYRDRLFNGSLGFRTIHQTAGFLLTSPDIPIGTTGINLRYQGSANWIEADTDRLDILRPIPVGEVRRENDRASMVRFQGIVEARKGIFLWVGEPLPATAEEGLRYSPIPIVPFVRVFFNARGISGLYSRSDPDYNLSLRGTVGLQGQFGHFSNSFLDYTGFIISFSETLSDGESPFFFDREVDRRRLTLGLTQQIVGPLRATVQTSINLRTGEAFSTDYILEYSRRSYGVVLLFNPDREVGSLTLRISDFNWTGTPEPFFETEDF